MTEEEAINDLTSMITGNEEAPQEAQQEEAPAVVEEPKEADIKIDVSKIMAEQTKLMSEQSKKIDALTKQMEEKDKEEPTEEELAIAEAQRKLGIDAQQQQKMQEFLAKQERMEAFNAQLSQLQKEHPEIDPQKMAKFAEDNGLMDLLNSHDINQWRVVANTMKQVAKIVDKPDNIIPSAPKGAENSIWEKVDKGEKVDDIDLGIDLLKGIGAWNG